MKRMRGARRDAGHELGQIVQAAGVAPSRATSPAKKVAIVALALALAEQLAPIVARVDRRDRKAASSRGRLCDVVDRELPAVRRSRPCDATRPGPSADDWRGRTGIPRSTAAATRQPLEFPSLSRRGRADANEDGAAPNAALMRFLQCASALRCADRRDALEADLRRRARHQCDSSQRGWRGHSSSRRKAKPCIG